DGQDAEGGWSVWDPGGARKLVSSKRMGWNPLAARAGSDVGQSAGGRECPAGTHGLGRRPVGLGPGDGDLASRRNAAFRLARTTPNARPGSRLRRSLVERAAPARGRAGRIRADRWDQRQTRRRSCHVRTDTDRRWSNVHIRVALADPIFEWWGRRALRLPLCPRTGFPPSGPRRTRVPLQRARRG